MELKVGAFYVTRDGRKARIYALDGEANTGAEVHGAVLDDGENGKAWEPANWSRDGEYISGAQSSQDLISVWVEPASKLIAWVCIQRTSPTGPTARDGDIWFSAMAAQPNSAYWRRAPWLDEP